jgi:Ca2+-binding EF-hand superfamily protein
MGSNASKGSTRVHPVTSPPPMPALQPNTHLNSAHPPTQPDPTPEPTPPPAQASPPVEQSTKSTPAASRKSSAKPLKVDPPKKPSSAKIAVTPEASRKTGELQQANNNMEHPEVHVSDDSAPPSTHQSPPPSPPPLQPVADKPSTEFIPRAEQAELMRVYARWIFEKADDDHDECLLESEFMSLVQSPTLGLRISDEEAREMMQEFCEDAKSGLTFDHFIPMLKDLMMRQSLAKQQREKSEWQWFIMHFDDLPVYYNTIDDVMTYTKPAGVSDERDLQVQDFENMYVNGVVCSASLPAPISLHAGAHNVRQRERVPHVSGL